ncbi:MAG TPA: HAMP domain-containing sensor histidine kinase, partial [Methanomicrobiales archaeon]|nr:HAMP domain-containing sensor histidine kinase [Methanomicrobiales archaeon]
MANATDTFEERLSKDYDLKGRTRRVIILSAVLYLSFLLLDKFTTTMFTTFLIIRLVVIAAHIVLLALLNRIKTNRGYTNVCIVLALFDVGGISLMIWLLGGFASMYVQGLYLIIIGIVIVVPLAFRQTVWLFIFIWASYVIPSVTVLLARRTSWLDVFTNLFFLSAMVLLGIFGSYIMENIRRRELTSRIRLEETAAQLQESNAKLKTLDELKTQFFANVNHELRTPLTLMLAPLKAILESRMGRLSAVLRDTLETMQRNGYKLLKLINNLLDLTKLEEGKMRLKIKTVNFIDFTASLLSSVKPMADQKQIRLYFQHPPHEVDLTIDPDQFEKVILNLLSNALKFTPKAGKITVYV